MRVICIYRYVCVRVIWTRKRHHARASTAKVKDREAEIGRKRCTRVELIESPTKGEDDRHKRLAIFRFGCGIIYSRGRSGSA